MDLNGEKMTLLEKGRNLLTEGGLCSGHHLQKWQPAEGQPAEDVEQGIPGVQQV